MPASCKKLLGQFSVISDLNMWRRSLRYTKFVYPDHHAIRSMSTRACYTLINNMADMGTKCNVYVHHDGYPRGAAEKIKGALRYEGGLAASVRHQSFAYKLASCKLPEVVVGDEALREDQPAFCAAMILLYHGEISQHWSEHGDLECRYEIRITSDTGLAEVRSFACVGWYDQECHELHGFVPFEQFERWAVEYQP